MASRSATHSWDVAEAEKRYLSNRELSYDNIANEFGVSLSAVKRFAARREWPKRRQNATENGLSRHQRNVEDELAIADKEHRLVARNIITLSNKLLEKLGKDLDQGKDIDARELLSLASAVHKGIMLERTIVGLPIIIAKAEIREVEEPKKVSTEENRQALEKYARSIRRRTLHEAGIDPNTMKPFPWSKK